VKAKPFLICGAFAGPFFTIAWILESVTRADYNLLRHPISSLSIGVYGWTQAANFIITYFLTLALAIGTHRALKHRGGTIWGPLMIGVIAIGFLGAGLFVTDPMNGYPLGTPAVPMPATMSGTLHNTLSMFVFVGMPAACFVFTRRFFVRHKHGWAIYTLLSGLAIVLMFGLTSKGFQQGARLVDVAGLFQRITLTIGWLWLTLLAFHLLKTPSETTKT
jgi:hypothetical protein